MHIHAAPEHRLQEAAQIHMLHKMLLTQDL